MIFGRSEENPEEIREEKPLDDVEWPEIKAITIILENGNNPVIDLGGVDRYLAARIFMDAARLITEIPVLSKIEDGNDDVLFDPEWVEAEITVEEFFEDYDDDDEL